MSATTPPPGLVLSARTARGWPPAMTATAAVILAVLLLYRRDWATIASVWLDSETFAHGMLVAPISAWLVWRKRSELAGRSPRLEPLALLALAACGLVWLVADLARVNAAAQFALVGMIIATVVLFTGRGVARIIAFPLAFLLLMVPFGEFLLPTMMNHTADFTVWAVRASGVPVYREGLHFVLPSGRWSVVEACSGLRYLIASIVLGLLYAHLYLRTTRRRLQFVALSVLVPVVANWVRAYGIVMLGHVSDMRIAVGADHLLYGWLFFGVVMFVLFSIGARWREPEAATGPAGPPTAAQPVAQAPAGASTRPTAQAGTLATTATLILALAAALSWKPLGASLLDRTTPIDFRAGFQAALPGLLHEERPLGFRPSVTGARQTVSGTLPGAPSVAAFGAYFARQHEGTEMVAHGNTLVAPSDRDWHPVDVTSTRIAVGTGHREVRRVVLVAPDERRLLVYQWFAVGETRAASEVAVKLHTAVSVLRGAGDHSVFNAVWTALDATGTIAAADKALADAVRAVDPATSPTAAAATR